MGVGLLVYGGRHNNADYAWVVYNPVGSTAYSVITSKGKFSYGSYLLQMDDVVLNGDGSIKLVVIDAQRD